jgi:septation ring formation regulator EzrA
MLRRLRHLTDIGNQQVCHGSQQSSTINDSQAFLIHSLMDRVLKQGDAITEMETTLMGIKNSLDAFKSVIQKVETNTSLSIPNLLTTIKNQTDQIPTLKKEILELQNKVEILQTSLEQFKIEQHERMTNGRGKSTCKSCQTCLFFSSKIH